VQRGEIWWADLPGPTGSERGFRRPILIVQADAFNRSRIRTVVAAVITSNLQLAAAPGNVALARSGSGLKRKSIVNVSQIMTLDKRFLRQKAGRVPARKLHEVDDGLRLVLAL
jgi:mRNA interferase MazF